MSSPNQYVSCTRKVAYFSETYATEYLGEHSWREHFAGYLLAVYKCAFGEHWHIGNKKANNWGEFSDINLKIKKKSGVYYGS